MFVSKNLKTCFNRNHLVLQIPDLMRVRYLILSSSMANENEVIELDNEENVEAEPSDEFMEEQKRAADAMKLPQAPIDRIIKEMLPPGMQCTRETRAIFSRAVSVFIICLGTASHDSAVSAKRKGILEKDVLSALKKMHLNIPEITMLLENFKANAEQQKQAKAADSSKVNDTNAEEANVEETNVEETNAEEANVEETNADEEAENMQVDEVVDDDHIPTDSLSILPPLNRGVAVMNRKSDGSADESNSAEKMSTTDWTDEDESKDELDLKANGTAEDYEESETDSQSESDGDTDQERHSSNTPNGHHRMRKKGRRRRAGKRKRLTWKRGKLLDDIDEDYAYLDEAKENSQIDPRLFDMSEEQIDYYTKCFLHLQRKTQGSGSIGGAVNGGDDRVVEFFRKSQLDTQTLSRIWSLADINEDGFLNHSEFLLAMHLIVLNVKGNVPIPSQLPSPARPCITPTRLLQPIGNELQNSTASSTLSSTADNASTSRGSEVQTTTQQAPVQHYHHFQQHKLPGTQAKQAAHLLQATNSYAENSSPKHHSLSDDHLHINFQRDAIISNFSDAPPLLVDSRPTALNATTSSAGFAMLNSLALRGPPPKPPQRQYTDKGHGRSASLDLNTLAVVTGQLQKPNASMFQSTTASAGNPPTTMNIDESAYPFTSNSAHFCFSQTPPIPLRPQLKAVEVQTKATQTDDEAKSSLDEHTFAALLEGVQTMSPAERCRVLRLYNSELEKERSTLAQIRLQLELRLEEAEQALLKNGIRVEPLPSTSPTQQTSISVSSPKPTTV
ncbi:hypothetical protein M3Y97_00128000 [Aphelenchoides bicaudatus]|nr:hypothetical protein M3Y97_00128000 [Aphelenchoides bicaudatus]